jgi:hypothetical protein
MPSRGTAVERGQDGASARPLLNREKYRPGLPGGCDARISADLGLDGAVAGGKEQAKYRSRQGIRSPSATGCGTM